MLKPESILFAYAVQGTKDDKGELVPAQVSEVDRAYQELCALRQCCKAFLLKVHKVVTHPDMQGMFVHAWAHGAEYKGPHFGEEMTALQKALGIAELPKHEYRAIIRYELQRGDEVLAVEEVPEDKVKEFDEQHGQTAKGEVWVMCRVERIEEK